LSTTRANAPDVSDSIVARVPSGPDAGRESLGAEVCANPAEVCHTRTACGKQSLAEPRARPRKAENVL
jgi:hypothetical protein